jgi:hypothetical protein
MVIQGINLRHLPHQCSLSTRQKKLLKQALEYGIRGYSPVPPTSTQKIYIADAVKALYRNLSMGPQLSDTQGGSYDLSDLFTKEELKTKMEKQLEIERQGCLQIPLVDCGDADKSMVRRHQQFSAVKDIWLASLTKVIEEESQKVKEKRRQSQLVVSAEGAANLKMLVDILEPKELANIVLDKVCQFALPQLDGIHIHFLCVRTGLDIEQRYALKKKEQYGAIDTTAEMYTEYLDYFFDKKLPRHIGPRDFWCQLEQKSPWRSMPVIRLPAWPAALHLHVYITMAFSV